MMREDAWRLFVTESNRIEGILRPPTDDEYLAHAQLLVIDRLGIADLATFVWRIQPSARLRLNGECVTVGSHVPPAGGPAIGYKLDDLLYRVNEGEVSPWHAHVEYETLHPFTDGNGRSGRALWAWQMFNQAHNKRWMELGFLHLFYYQTLSNRRT